MEKTKLLQYRTDSKQLLENAARDFRFVTEKSPMITVGEMSKWRQKEYARRLFSFLDKCVNNPDTEGNFFIEVHRWHELADRCTLRYRLRQLAVLPTPAPGRAYFEYNAETQELSLLWDLPPKRACEWVLRNKIHAGMDVPAATKTILDWYDGTLKQKAIEINEQVVKRARKI